jgi:hypothetical protein
MNFIKDVIQNLKKEYGTPIRIGNVVASSANLSTGDKTQSTKELSIPLAIRLPTQVSFEFLRSIGAVPNKLGVLTGTFQLLLDCADLGQFDVTAPNTYFFMNNQKFDVLKAEVFDDVAIILAKDIGQKAPKTYDFVDRLDFLGALGYDRP